VNESKNRTGKIKKVNNSLILLFLGLFICTCIDPFNPNIKGKSSLLVVDALLTNENRSYTVRLFRTTATQNEDPVMVTNATVTITDQDEKTSDLIETSEGIYKTDSLSFLGQPGNAYTLYIRTGDGNEYRSESAIMYPVPPIDNIYYIQDQEFLNNNTEVLEGLRIFLNSENSGGGLYFRWIYDEWWKFSVPYPKRYNYIDKDNIPLIQRPKQVCYGHNGSKEILIHSVESSQSYSIEKQPILFVPFDTSDRFLIQYCIDIKQLSVSGIEYQFWQQMKEINEGGGDIFDQQPFSIVGNIHNINNPAEVVLGYFQVSAVEESRLYITHKELEDLNLPSYSYDCQKIEFGPGDFPTEDPSSVMTFDKIYARYTFAGYEFIEPVWDLRMNLIKLAFAKPFCADCSLSGNIRKPDFWIDLDLPK
jgi:hypothetical protein